MPLERFSQLSLTWSESLEMRHPVGRLDARNQPGAPASFVSAGSVLQCFASRTPEPIASTNRPPVHLLGVFSWHVYPSASEPHRRSAVDKHPMRREEACRLVIVGQIGGPDWGGPPPATHASPSSQGTFPSLCFSVTCFPSMLRPLGPLYRDLSEDLVVVVVPKAKTNSL